MRVTRYGDDPDHDLRPHTELISAPAHMYLYDAQTGAFVVQLPDDVAAKIRNHQPVTVEL
jgi:hypothetical protein